MNINAFLQKKLCDLCSYLHLKKLQRCTKVLLLYANSRATSITLTRLVARLNNHSLGQRQNCLII